MSLQFEPFVRIPFAVQAIEVTDENIVEVAEGLGRVCRATGGQQYIDPIHGKFPSDNRIWTGSFITKVGEGDLRCYSARAFKAQFIRSTERWRNLIDDLNSNGKPDHPTLVDRALGH